MDAALERIAIRLLEHGSGLVVMSGMSEGWDECLARAALKLKVRLWCSVPNRGYGDWYWRDHSQLGRNRLPEFNDILSQAWKVTYVMEQIHGTKALKHEGLHANFWRNIHLVENADDFAVLGPVKPKSGTAHCVETIRAAGKWRDDMVLGPDPLSDQTALLMGTVSAS
jgi:hypothetical protein